MVWRGFWLRMLHDHAPGPPGRPWVHRGVRIWFAPCNSMVVPLRNRHLASRLPLCPKCTRLNNNWFPSEVDT